MHPEISQWYIYVCIKFNWNIPKIVSLQHFSDSSPRSITSTLQQKNTSVLNLPTFYIHVMGFSSGTLPPKGSAPVSFHHNFDPSRFWSPGPGGGSKFIAKAGFKSTFVVSTFRGRETNERQAFNDDGGYATSCAIWPLALTFVAVDWCLLSLFPPHKKPQGRLFDPENWDETWNLKEMMMSYALRKIMELW